jgi:hypothetical protein
MACYGDRFTLFADSTYDFSLSTTDEIKVHSAHIRSVGWIGEFARMNHQQKIYTVKPRSVVPGSIIPDPLFNFCSPWANHI